MTGIDGIHLAVSLKRNYKRKWKASGQSARDYVGIRNALFSASIAGPAGRYEMDS